MKTRATVCSFLPILAGLIISPAQVLVVNDHGFFERGFIWSSLLAFGPLFEILQVFIGSWLLHLIGRRLGGRAAAESIAPVIAWSNAPLMLLLIPGWTLALVDEPLKDWLFHASMTDLPELMLVGTLILIELAIVLWSLRILVAGLAAVHGYSTLRAVQTIVIAWLTVAATVIVLAVVLGLTPYLGRFFAGSFWGVS